MTSTQPETDSDELIRTASMIRGVMTRTSNCEQRAVGAQRHLEPFPTAPSMVMTATEIEP